MHYNDIHLNTALAVGEEEEIVSHVPRDFVHLELELPLCLHLVCSAVDEGDQIFFVSNSDRVPVRTPSDVNVLPLGGHRGHRLVAPCVPHPHCLVPRGRGEHVWLGRVPTELVNTVAVALEDVLLGQPVRAETEYADSFVVGARGQLLSITAPVDRVNFAGVRDHLSGLVVLLEPRPDLIHRGLHHPDGRSFQLLCNFVSLK